ncbi:porin [Agitococcus lubricus]|uniref:Putative porin n=1 Tax=Agitococcus lubricus TaxID=1077255 RepID=A0A2T5IWR3_9GAMM|nr:porin [Agitococcus lubricus]PTQ88322.1 putative porin [Agitococcus lubricus]
MKRNLIALAVLSATVAPLTAQANPKVYGQINLSAEAYEQDRDGSVNDQEFTRMQSNASRFGVKGEAELTGTLSAVYGIEWEVTADGDDISRLSASTTTAVDTNGDGKADSTDGKATSTSTISNGNRLDLTQRNRFIGIKHQDFGTIKMGKYDTYLKLAQGKVDLFNDFAADMQFTIAGENRINNVIGYESPKIMNTQFNIMAQTQDTASKATNGNSLSIVHHNEESGLYLALAADMGINGSSAVFSSRENDTMRLVGSYKIADLTLNALYSTSSAVVETKRADGKMYDDAETAYLLGAAYKLNDIVFKAQYSAAEADDTDGLAATANVEKTQATIGADYNFSSKTRAFVWYTMQEETKKVAINNIETNILAIGMETKF